MSTTTSMHPLAYGRPVASALLLALSLLIAPRASGQDGPRGGGDLEEQLDRVMADLTQAVELDEGQAEAIRVILAEQFEKQRAMRGGLRDGSRRDRRAALKKARALQEETDKRVEALLSERQLAAYRDFREAQRAERRGRRDGRPGG